jgi:integrase
VHICRWHGNRCETSLGSARYVPLASFRENVKDANAKLALGIKPTSPKHAGGTTFSECADRLIEAMRPSWRHEKHVAQWIMTLRVHAAPLRRLPVDKITTDDVLSVLKPIWNRKPVTAARVRGRIERVLDAAKAQGLRGGENPARWRGHLDHLLPARSKVRIQHYAALPYDDVPAFMGALQSRDATAARALEFLVLTAARSSEVLGARWEEFDLEGAVWTTPPGRMKGAREHRVPLSKRAIEIIKAMHEGRNGDFVFPGARPGKPLSAIALAMLLGRMKVEDATVHGFRSSFRDWAAECTSFPNEVCEAALAHAVSSAVERAYRRGDLFEKRRKLMDAWSTYCTTSKAGAVIPITAGRNVADPQHNVSALPRA